MLCHPQQIASTKTNLLLYDKRTCLGRNKLNLGVVIWVWCLHIWPMPHRPAEVRVSNYYAGVLRIVQRDAKANGMFVQLTSPWRERVLLGTLCAMNEALQKNSEGLSGNRVGCSVFLPFEDGLMHFVPGDLEEKHLPGPWQVTFSQLFFWRLCCVVERDGAEIALQERDGGSVCQAARCPASSLRRRCRSARWTTRPWAQQPKVQCWKPRAACPLLLLQLDTTFGVASQGAWQRWPALREQRLINF